MALETKPRRPLRELGWSSFVPPPDWTDQLRALLAVSPRESAVTRLRWARELVRQCEAELVRLDARGADRESLRG